MKLVYKIGAGASAAGVPEIQSDPVSFEKASLSLAARIGLKVGEAPSSSTLLLNASGIFVGRDMVELCGMRAISTMHWLRELRRLFRHLTGRESRFFIDDFVMTAHYPFSHAESEWSVRTYLRGLKAARDEWLCSPVTDDQVAQPLLIVPCPSTGMARRLVTGHDEAFYGAQWLEIGIFHEAQAEVV